jgi:multidrug resistance efflux pump
MIHSLLLGASLILAPPEAQAALTDPVDDKCVLASIAEIQVPAEEAGALVSLEVKEGMTVKAGMELGRIDYREAEAEVQVRQADYDVAQFKAKSKVAVEYAKKAAAVAKTVYDKYELANTPDKKGGANLKTVAMTELLKYKLEWEKAEVTIDKEKEELEAARLTAKGKAAELEASKVSLDKRTLRSPIDGKVVQVYRHVGEWVAPGEAVFRIVSVDRLKIVSNLDANEYGPSDVSGRPVTVEVSLPRGQKSKLEGKVVSVNPVVGIGFKLPVTIELDTPMEHGEPLIRAGQRAAITIHLNGQAPTAAARGESTRLGKRGN